MERPPMTVTSVVIGAREPRELAAFYERLLGWQIVANEPARPGFPPEDGWAMLRSPSDRGVMAIAVQWEPDYEPPVWPPRNGEPAMMLHLDIQADDGDVANAVAWAVECGATLAEHQPQDHTQVLFDPAGHPFCLFPNA
ncbi:MAG TPA: VOC family protein [Mycobacterium sp.]